MGRPFLRMTQSHPRAPAAPSGEPGILVLSRRNAQNHEPVPGEACVSITNPRQSPAALKSSTDVLRLGFHDTDRRGGNFTPMSFKDAVSVLEFGLRHRQAPLMVHCEFGASRSVAVGLFLAAWFRRPLRVTETDVLMPNPWVLRQLRLAALYGTPRFRDPKLLKCAVFGTTDFLASLVLDLHVQSGPPSTR